MRLFSVTLFLLVLSAALTASAQDASERGRTRARATYNRAQRAFGEGDFEAAQRGFEQAYEILPNPVVLLSIAECQQQRGLWQDAESNLARYLHDVPDGGGERARVEEQLQSIRAMPGTLIVDSIPSGAAIQVDGSDTAQVTPARITLSPGEHALVLEAADGSRAEQAFSLRFASELTLNLELSAPVAEVAPTPPAPPPNGPSSASESRARLGRAAWTSAGIGLAAGLGVAVLGPIALAKSKAYARTPTEQRQERGARLALTTDICLGVAAAGALTALVLFAVRAAKHPEPREVGFRWSPTLSTQRVGFDAEVRF